MEDDQKLVEQEFQEAFTLDEQTNTPDSPKLKNYNSLPHAEIISNIRVTPTTKPLSLTLEPESEEDEIAL